MATHDLPALQMVRLMDTHLQWDSIRTDNILLSDDRSSNHYHNRSILIEHRMVRRNASTHASLNRILGSTSAHLHNVALHTVPVAHRQH